MGKTFRELRLPRRREYRDDGDADEDSSGLDQSESDDEVLAESGGDDLAESDDEILEKEYESLLDELQSEKSGADLEMAKRRWARYAISVALEEIPRKFRRFDTSFVKSLQRQLKSKGRLSDKQLDALNRIVRGFRVEREVRKQCTTGRRVIRR